MEVQQRLKISDGWLSPGGEWFPCAYWGHTFKALDILRERYPGVAEAMDGGLEDYSLYTPKLEELGWIRYSTIFNNWVIPPKTKPTPSQKDKAWELTAKFI